MQKCFDMLHLRLVSDDKDGVTCLSCISVGFYGDLSSRNHCSCLNSFDGIWRANNIAAITQHAWQREEVKVFLINYIVKDVLTVTQAH